MKILTVVGCGGMWADFFFSILLYFPIFHWEHSMLIIVTLHTKLQYQETIIRSIGKTSVFYRILL